MDTNTMHEILTKKSVAKKLAESDRPTFRAESCRCDRCGGAGGWKGWPGFTCYRCGGNGVDPTYVTWVLVGELAPAAQAALEAFQARREQRAAKAAAERQAIAEAARAAAVVRFEAICAEHPAVAWVNENMEKVPPFARSIIETILEKGAATDRQIAALDGARIEATTPKAEVIEGRRVVSGEIVGTRLTESAYGTRSQIVVKLEDGTKIMGSLPGGIEPRKLADGESVMDEIAGGGYTFKGVRITMTATIARGTDPSFGFFKRPTKAEHINN